MGEVVVLLVTIPLVTAFVGYITNWAAVKMIFWPEEFVGVGPIGWQGVLPRRSDTFASDVADTATEKVLSARELAERLDPAEMEALFEDRLAAETADLVREVAEILRPGLWDTIVPDAQDMIVAQVRAETQAAARDIFDHLQGVSDEVLDLRAMVVGLLTGDNVDRLVRLFQRIGATELRFIEVSGAYFGFAIGLAQVAAFQLLDQWWLMPIVGVGVGLVTNWLAIQMIFRPQEERRVLGVFRYQGLFPKRQADISREYGRISADEIFTPANLMRLLTEGESGTRIAQVVIERVSERIDAQRPMLEAITQTTVTTEQLEQVKWLLVARVTQTIPDVQPEIERYLERKLDIANLVESKLSRLPKPEFERLLRGIFEQDEWILIVIGGALGGAVGLLQGALVLATGA